MKIVLTIFFMLVIQMLSFGQHFFGLKINGGLSYLDTKMHFNEINEKIYYQPSGQFGIYDNFFLKNKYLIGIDLFYLQIEGKQYFEIPETDQNGIPTGLVFTDNIWRHISYLGIPVYFGFKLKKFNINLGFQTNLTIKSSAREKGLGHSTNTGLVTWDNKINKLNIASYDYGLRLALCYNVYNRLSIEADYYYGLTNILKNKSIGWQWKVRQITIGVRYIIFRRPRFQHFFK